MPRLDTRIVQPELMDQPGLDATAHHRALGGLQRLNYLSRSAQILWRPIRDLARRQKRSSLRLLDVATGGGDVPLQLWRTARSAGLELNIVGCDVSATALDHARKAAERLGAPIRFVQQDVLQELPPDSFDVVMTSLFLHHLSREDAIRLLTCMSDVASHMLLVNDLRRSWGGYFLAQLACQAVTRSPIVHLDGPRSVENAFRMSEVRDLCAEIPLTGASVLPCFPFRFLLEWEPCRAV